MLVPVGGTYTVDATGAKQVCDAINPKWVIPMHYRHGTYGFPALLEAEDFLALWDEDAVHRLETAGTDVSSDSSGVLVFKFA